MIPDDLSQFAPSARAYLEEARGIFREFEAAGFQTSKLKEIKDLHEQIKPKDKQALEIVIKHFQRSENVVVLHQLAVLLRKVKLRYDGTLFIKPYETFHNPDFRLNVSLAIYHSLPSGLEGWLKQVILNEAVDPADKVYMFPALAKYLPEDEALRFFHPLYENNKQAVAMAWAHCGGQRELDILEGLLPSYTDWPRQELKRNIAKIRARLNKRQEQSLAPALSQENPSPMLAPTLSKS